MHYTVFLLHNCICQRRQCFTGVCLGSWLAAP